MSPRSLAATLSTICPSCGGTDLEWKDDAHFCNECGHHWTVEAYLKNNNLQGGVAPSLQVKPNSYYVKPLVWIKGWVAGWLFSWCLIWLGITLHQTWMIALGGIYFLCTPWIAHKDRSRRHD